MTIKLAWENTNPILSSKGTVRCSMGSWIPSQHKSREVEIFPILKYGAMNGKHMQDYAKSQQLHSMIKCKNIAEEWLKQNKLRRSQVGNENGDNENG